MAKRVLILCTANSARSQMAEGLLRDIGGEKVEVFSAGSTPSRVNPYAIEAMTLRGIDINSHRSKSLQEFIQQPFDYVITVCDNAADSCPVFPGKAERIHWSFPDPATMGGNYEEILASFVSVRDGLEEKFTEFVKGL